MQGLKPSSQPSGPFRVDNSDTYSDGTPRYRNNGAFNPQSYTGKLHYEKFLHCQLQETLVSLP